MAFNRPKASTTARGYGAKHAKARAAYQRRLDQGEQFTCPHCQQPVTKGMEWHLDHTADRLSYRGPSHAICNLKDGARRGRAAQANSKTSRSTPTQWLSRRW